MATVTDNCDDHEIKVLIDQLFHHRKAKRLKEADQLKKQLLDQHSVQVFYRRNGSIGWRFISKDEEGNVNAFSHRDNGKRVLWSLVPPPPRSSSSSDNKCQSDGIPLTIATIDTPTYRKRLAETLDHLSLPVNDSDDETDRFHPIDVVDLLILEEHQSIGKNRIVHEGWRQVLLPKLLENYNSKRMIFIAEDDIRLAASPSFIERVCFDVFDSNPDLDILSLGHAYAAKKKANKRQEHQPCAHDFDDKNGSEQSDSGATATTPILEHLQRGKGIHASTLLAIRYPEGVKSLMEALESVPMRKRGK